MAGLNRNSIEVAQVQGLVSWHLVRKSSTDEMRVCRYLSGEFPTNGLHRTNPASEAASFLLPDNPPRRRPNRRLTRRNLKDRSPPEQSSLQVSCRPAEAGHSRRRT